MIKPDILEQLTETMSSVLPRGLSEDLRQNLRAALKSQLDKLGLVTREELDIQENVLRRTQTQLKALEHKVAELEQKLKSK